MKTIYTYILLSFALVIGVSSCSKTDDTVTDDKITKGKSIEFTISNAMETKTPGVDALNENKITRMDVFFYQGEVLKYYPLDNEVVISGSKVIINIPDAVANILFGQTYNIFFLANSTLPRASMEGKSFDALRRTALTNIYDFNVNPFVAQPAFLMNGRLMNTVISEAASNLGTVSLSRSASKITVEVDKAEIMGYTPGVAEAKLVNYLNTTLLSSELQYQADMVDYKTATKSIGDLSTGGRHITDPFYSYANNWDPDANKTSYISLVIPWTNQLTGTTQPYYYRISFNYIKNQSDPDLNKYQLRRNYIYSFITRIGVLGGESLNNAVELQFNVDIKNWNEQQIDVNINEYDYLVVFDNVVTMNNVTSTALRYTSSKPIVIENIKVTCSEYAVSGAITEKIYAPTDWEYPTFTINTATNQIFVNTSVPENYVPKKITFDVKNTALLKKSVSITVYPTKYIEATHAEATDPTAGSTGGGGTNNPDGATGQTNFNMFTLNTQILALGDIMPLGTPYFGMPITLGDPTEMVNGVLQTKQDLLSNAVMSPQFLVASQRGISSIHTYPNAVARCREYREGIFPRGSWRVPTAAELYYGSQLQRDPKSAVKGLFMSGDYSWWTAFNPYGLNFQSYTLVNATEHYIRCVHDVWKD